MSNELQIFENAEFGKVRTVLLAGKPYAVGIDVARALGYAKPSQAIIDHCKGIRKSGIPSKGGIQETNVIPEGDIYRLIVKSNLPSAERFESWVFDEVLPQIRKTGSYSKPMSQVEILAQAAQQLVEQERELARLRLDNEEIRKEQKIQSSRIDTLNGVCTEGTKRQKLVAMIQAYAAKNGLTYREGWHRFKAAYGGFGGQ